MEIAQIEYHPLKPFLPENTKLLMLGSFPPGQKRWSMDFYYPNLQNDMWRIVGLVFFNDKAYFISDKKFDKVRIMEFCSEKGIALADMAHGIIRLNHNASDKFLDIVELVDLKEIFKRIPSCRTVITTGQKATSAFCSMINLSEPEMGGSIEFIFNTYIMRLYRMPSSSRAYPKSLNEKAIIYGGMFRAVGIL